MKKRLNKILISEFKENPNYVVLFETNNLKLGRMIGSSKSTYSREHAGDLVIFNANVITEKYGKIWYGDLNINLDFDLLKNAADFLKEDLYILMEGDARFGYENKPFTELANKAKAVIRCNKKEKKTKNKKNGKN